MNQQNKPLGDRTSEVALATIEQDAGEAARSLQSPILHKRAERGPQHFGFIDALRGIAILAVIIVHVTQQISGGPMLRFGPKGAFGVQLFFVVSAFTLFWSLKSRFPVERRPIASYFVRRLFRIAPLFWIATVFYAYHPGYWRIMFAPAGIGAKQILTTLFFVHGWSPLTCNAVVPGGWSIATECTFYLFVPILFSRVRTLTAALWLAFISTVLVSIAAPIATSHLSRLYPQLQQELIVFFVYTSFPSQIPVFSLGLVLYFILINRAASAASTPSQPAPSPDKRMALLLVLLAPALFVSSGIPEHVVWGFAFVALAAGLAIHPFRLAVNPLTRFIGTISFSAYIWHFWVIEKIAGPVISWIGLKSLPISARGTIQFCVLYPATVLVTVAVSTLSYNLIEVPGQNLGKALIAHFGWGAARRDPVTL
jgi:peptidoglycan/LPS O-acetylase OafA/YrhL